MKHSSFLWCTLLSFLALPGSGFAGSATWNLDPSSSDWNTAANWTPATVPNGPTDVATCDVSNNPEIAVSAQSTEVRELVFNPGASAFTITASTRTGLTFCGVGITNNSEVTQHFVTTSFDGGTSLGPITFTGQASAGSGTVFTNNDGAGVVFDVGATNFRDHSSGGYATLINRGGTGPGRYGGETNFYGGNGGHCTIVVEGAKVSGAAGGFVYVGSGSSLENATLIVNGGAGQFGGLVIFDEGSSGGAARVKVFSNGNIDFSTAALDPEVAVGSIEGNGRIALGSSILDVGTNNRSTTFAGLIADGSSTDGSGGCLRKTGRGVLSLTRGNNYSGCTIVDGGGLSVNNRIGSATGSGPVRVNAGTLAGNGKIAGVVTLGIGSGAGAILSPSQGPARPATLTMQGSLTIKADGTFACKINTKQATADQVIANGITLESGAQFSLNAVAHTMLAAGEVFTVLNNVGATPISGTFADLADGSTIIVDGNSLQVSYEGGDGNDLTLTVMP